MPRLPLQSCETHKRKGLGQWEEGWEGADSWEYSLEGIQTLS